VLQLLDDARYVIELESAEDDMPVRPGDYMKLKKLLERITGGFLS